MVGVAGVFIVYVFVELAQAVRVREMVTIRLLGGLTLLAFTWSWLHARRDGRQTLAALSGLAYSTTVSLLTTLAAAYGGSEFGVPLAYGYLIAVLNVVLWSEGGWFLLGFVGALTPPTILMFMREPTTTEIVDYVALHAVTIIVASLVFYMRQLIFRETATLHAALRKEASVDTLTGLLNRRAWAERVSTWEQAHPHDAATLMYMDLDRFKTLNDAHGHDVGDRALVVFAEALRTVLPQAAAIARFGGDEFVALVPGTIEEAERLGHEVRAALAGPSLREFGLSVSIGLAASTPGGSREAMLHDADQAMLATKGARAAPSGG